MINDQESSQHLQPGRDQEERGRERMDQFNELSELSLEERMAVADRMGIPVYNEPDAAAKGTGSGNNDSQGGANERMDTGSTDEERDR